MRSKPENRPVKCPSCGFDCTAEGLPLPEHRKDAYRAIPGYSSAVRAHYFDGDQWRERWECLKCSAFIPDPAITDDAGRAV